MDLKEAVVQAVTSDGTRKGFGLAISKPVKGRKASVEVVECDFDTMTFSSTNVELHGTETEVASAVRSASNHFFASVSKGRV